MSLRAVLSVILLGIVLVADRPAAAMTPRPRISVTYQAPLISIEASGATVAEVLREVARKVGFSVAEAGSSDARLSFTIRDTPVPEALQRLLQSENHVLRYRKGTQTIETVTLLGARGARTPAPVNQRDQAFSHSGSHDQSRTNPPSSVAPTPTPTAPASGMVPSTQADVDDYRRRAEGSPQVANATDLLLRQTSFGMPAPQSTSTSGGGSAASSSVTSAADPGGATLAMTTRLARQNMTKLVEALAAATSSMRSSQKR